MPGARLERLVVLLGLLALAGVIALAVRGWHRYERGGTASPARTSSRAATSASTAGRRPASTPTRQGRLVLRAVEGDCWMIVRAARSTGDVLYEGVVEHGRSVSFVGRRFWMRVGAAANVEARFDGRKLTGFPVGTATLMVDGSDVRVLG